MADLSSPERLDATVAAILDADNHQSSEPAELRLARRQADEARRKLDQYLAALDAGLDPVLVTERTASPRLSSLPPLPSSTPTRALNPIS